MFSKLLAPPYIRLCSVSLNPTLIKRWNAYKRARCQGVRAVASHKAKPTRLSLHEIEPLHGPSYQEYDNILSVLQENYQKYGRKVKELQWKNK